MLWFLEVRFRIKGHKWNIHNHVFISVKSPKTKMFCVIASEWAYLFWQSHVSVVAQERQTRHALEKWLFRFSSSHRMGGWDEGGSVLFILMCLVWLYTSCLWVVLPFSNGNAKIFMGVFSKIWLFALLFRMILLFVMKSVVLHSLISEIKQSWRVNLILTMFIVTVQIPNWYQSSPLILENKSKIKIISL